MLLSRRVTTNNCMSPIHFFRPLFIWRYYNQPVSHWEGQGCFPIVFRIPTTFIVDETLRLFTTEHKKANREVRREVFFLYPILGSNVIIDDVDDFEQPTFPLGLSVSKRTIRSCDCVPKESEKGQSSARDLSGTVLGVDLSFPCSSS